MYIYDEEVKVAITLNEDMKSVTAAVLSGNNALRKQTSDFNIGEITRITMIPRIKDQPLSQIKFVALTTKNQIFEVLVKVEQANITISVLGSY